MVTGGNATVFINNMDVALKFYSEVLGMKVASRYGNHWATVEAGGFTIGLHPKGEKDPVPGTQGAIMIGLMVDDLDTGAQKLRTGGAKNIGERIDGDGGAFVNFHDPDGNALYLWKISPE
jgi:predicted enzyme related to lactoylglutathione lyase